MEIPEIREKFLSRVMFHRENGHIKLSIKDVHTLRQVNRDWHDTVSAVFRSMKMPLFHLKLPMENVSCDEESDLSEFLRRMKMSPSADNVPTYALKLSRNFFRDKNRTSFQKLLTQYGLLSLHVYFPNNGNMACDFANISLPNLSEFRVECNNGYFILDHEHSKEAKAASDSHCISFVQGVIRAAVNLQRYSIFISNHGANLSQELESVVPPPSIVSLKYGRIHNAGNVCKLLTEGNFPKLQELQLHPAHFTAEMFFKILYKFRNTLKSFKLEGKIAYTLEDNNNNSPIFLRFPVMTQLEELSINSKIVDLEHGGMTVATNFPKLLKMELSDQSRLTALKWIMNGAIYQKVARVKLRLLNSKGAPKGKMDPGLIETVQQAFPNLTHLTLRLHGHQVDALRAVFTQLTCLEHLTLEMVKSSQCRCRMTAADWDSTLIGDHRQPSIHRLTKLKSLTLGEKIFSPTLDGTDLMLYCGQSISEETFELTFFKMPNLMDLSLSGSFWVSTKLKERWTKEKGKLEYTCGWTGLIF